MSKITIAAIIPVYNAEDYIEECLNSIFEQIIPFDEVIIINDGSTDKSAEIIEQICKYHSEVKYIYQSNRGQAVARNAGMRIVQTDYVVFIDADDFVSGDMVEVLQRNLVNQDLLLFSAGIKKEIQLTRYNNYNRMKSVCSQNMSGWEYFNKTYPEEVNVSPCLMAYRTDFLESNKIHFPEGIFYEDNFFFFQVINKAKYLMAIEEELYTRRYRADSTTTGMQTKKKKIDRIQVHIMVYEYLLEIYRDCPAEKKIINYIYRSCLAVLEKFCDEQDLEIHKYLMQMCEGFLKYVDWDNICEKSLLLSEAVTVRYVINYMAGRDDRFQMYQDKSRNILYRKVLEFLENLKLSDQGTHVGIYGIGNHTDILLKLYRMFIGNIECKCTYIVSEKKKEMDCHIYDPLIGVNAVTKDIERIIISSKIHQTEMEKCLKEAGYDEKKIILLYDKNEWLDIVSAEKLL